MNPSPAAAPCILALAAFALAGCAWAGAERHEDPPPPDPLEAVRRLLPIPNGLRYVEDKDTNGQRQTFEVEEDWNARRRDGARDVHEVYTIRYDRQADQRTFRRELVVFDPLEGFGHLATPPPDDPLSKQYVPFEPPMIVLPLRPVPGAHWDLTHTKGGITFTRSCHLEVAKRCDGGVVSHCDVVGFSHSAIRDTFCPGVGVVDVVVREILGDKRLISHTTTRAWQRGR